MSKGMSDKPDAQTPVLPAAPATDKAPPLPEIGGPKEADPTRYGDWTVKGRCIDF